MRQVTHLICAVFWGTGIVVFLIKIINLHDSNAQGFWVELCQQIETGLFTATSIGLIPFRALDTWRELTHLRSASEEAHQTVSRRGGMDLAVSEVDNQTATGGGTSCVVR